MGAPRRIQRPGLSRSPAFTSPILTRPCFPLAADRVTCRRTGAKLGLRRRRPARACAEHGEHTEREASAPTAPAPRRRIGVLATAAAKSGEEVTTSESAERGGGLFGMKARAYWESMGFLPLFFAGFGVLALGIKLLKVMQGQWKSGADGVNRAMTPESVITSPEMEQDLHVYKCSGCGYEIYPARGREFKFFPDSFKCPLCETPKSGFWDLRDADDERNQVEEEDGSGEQDLQPAGVPDLGDAGEAAENPTISDAPQTPVADASEPAAE